MCQLFFYLEISELKGRIHFIFGIYHLILYMLHCKKNEKSCLLWFVRLFFKNRSRKLYDISIQSVNSRISGFYENLRSKLHEKYYFETIFSKKQKFWQSNMTTSIGFFYRQNQGKRGACEYGWDQIFAFLAIFRIFGFSGVRLPRPRAAQGELGDATCMGWAWDMIKK